MLKSHSQPADVYEFRKIYIGGRNHISIIVVHVVGCYHTLQIATSTWGNLSKIVDAVGMRNDMLMHVHYMYFYTFQFTSHSISEHSFSFVQWNIPHKKRNAINQICGKYEVSHSCATN